MSNENKPMTAEELREEYRNKTGRDNSIITDYCEFLENKLLASQTPKVSDKPNPIDLSELTREQLEQAYYVECAQNEMLIQEIESIRKALSMQQSDAVEFAEWCVINANPIFPNVGRWHLKSIKEVSTQELYELFTQSKNQK